MQIKVFKLGGSLLNNIAGFKQIDKIIELYYKNEKHKQDNLIIVVSAFGKTTSNLLKATTTAEINGEINAIPIVDNIIEYHINIVDALIKSEKKKEECKIYIQEMYNQLMNYIKGISLIKELSVRTKDLVLSIGEMLASNIINKYLSENFQGVINFDITSVLRTNDNYGAAIPDIKSTEKHIKTRLLPLFKHCNIIVTQGFIGATADGEITTMGYESSNLTATILAALTSANEFVIWTDVEGIRQYDPKLTSDSTPKLINKINYDFAEYLGYNGLKLIYPKMIELLRQFNLEVTYKSGLNPTGEYTIIGKEGDSTTNIIINYDNLVTYSKSNIINKFEESNFSSMAHLLQHQTNLILISHNEHLFITNENVPIYIDENLKQLYERKNMRLLMLINFDFECYMKCENELTKEVKEQIINIFISCEKNTISILYKLNEFEQENSLAKFFINNFKLPIKNNI